jgi:DNA-binding transcriptional regulator YhcF (GntR family)
MKIFPFSKIIYIDRDSSIPLYLQIAYCIMQAIETGKLQNNDVLPSVNELSSILEVSRETVAKGYLYLKGLGVLGSVVGKGCFVKNNEWGNKARVLLLFNQLNYCNEIIYNSLINCTGETAIINAHVFHNNFYRSGMFLQYCQNEYDHYIFLTGAHKNALDLLRIIDMIPKEKLIVVGRKIKELNGQYSGVYENFEDNIFQVLQEAVQSLRKYHSIGLVSPGTGLHHSAILMGLRRFCSRYSFHCRVIQDMAREEVAAGVAYITLEEDDLVMLAEQILMLNLKAGTDVGIISFDEMPLKKLILNGITTISTDFRMMGEQIARLIIDRSIKQKEVRFFLTLRNSL